MLHTTSTTSIYYQDVGAPASSYQSDLISIFQGQMYLDSSNGDLYICTDASNLTSLVWKKVARVDQIPALVQADWTQSNTGDISYIKNKPAVRTQSSPIRSLNTAFQISSSRDASVNYSVDIACTLSLTTGQIGTVFLEIATDSGFTTNVQELGRSVNGNTGTLTIGLALTQNITGTLGGYVPMGYYCRLRTANTTGSPSFTFRSSQEVLL